MDRPPGHYNYCMIDDALEADGPQIEDIALRAEAFGDEEVDALGAVWEEYLILGPEDSGYNFLVDRDGDAIRGFVCYGRRDLTDGVYDLYYVAVDPDRRRQGTGRRLLTASEGEARQAGARMMIAETSAGAGRESIRELCLGAGYLVEATIQDFYAVGEDLAVMVKRF
jgi:ribosomal protein S18 acetylase RimI-like enzyme